MHRFEEELTCSICYSLFEDPRILPCAHTFCRSCLEEAFRLSQDSHLGRSLRVSLNCPSCRRSVDILTGGVESLPVNFALKAIVEKYQEEGRRDTATCSKHKGQPLNIYCLLDCKLVCGHCLTIGQHIGHPIDDLQNAYMKEKKSSEKFLEQLTDQYWSDVCLRIEKLKEQKSHCKSVIQADRKAVVQYFKKLSEALEHKEQSLLSALDELSMHVSEEYDPLIERLKKMRKEQLELMSLNTDLQKEESQLAFLEKMNFMQQRLKALKEEELPGVKALEIYPRVGHLITDVWSRTEIGQINKILVPELKLIPRKCCSRDCSKEGRESREPLQAVKPLAILLLLALILVAATASFHKLLSSAVFETLPTHLSQFLLPLWDFWLCLQDAAALLCWDFCSLLECLGIIGSF
ncbi:TRI59 protein, partial [Rhinopomastus cyanomelas]|nr:TRI59 protein [Rhinopomastus cyanomelas]